MQPKDMQVITENIAFIADQIINNDVSSDGEMIALFTDCGISETTAQNIVLSLRPIGLRGDLVTVEDVQTEIKRLEGNDHFLKTWGNRGHVCIDGTHKIF